jgi:hypothetical protein
MTRHALTNLQITRDTVNHLADGTVRFGQMAGSEIQTRAVVLPDNLRDGLSNRWIVEND